MPAIPGLNRDVALKILPADVAADPSRASTVQDRGPRRRGPEPPQYRRRLPARAAGVVPPRSEAGQHPADRGRTREDPRFQSGAHDPAVRTSRHDNAGPIDVVPASSLARSATCHPSRCADWMPITAATSSASAWCCTRCSGARGPSKVRSGGHDAGHPAGGRSRPAVDRARRRAAGGVALPQKDPAHRFQSARDLSFALPALAQGDSSSDAALAVPSPAPPAQRSRTWLWTGAANGEGQNDIWLSTWRREERRL